MKREYTAVIKKDGKGYVAWIKEVPGAVTQGRTLKEVRENLYEALSLMLEENQRIAALKSRKTKPQNNIRIIMTPLMGA